MKMDLEEHFTGAHGRACRNSKTYNRTNPHTGEVIVASLCHPYKGPASDEQVKVRTAFVTRAAAARAWRAVNAPTKQNPKGTAEFQALYKLWQSDRTSATWYAKLLTYIKDGKVPTFIIEGNNSVSQQPSAPSGGTDSSADSTEQEL